VGRNAGWRIVIADSYSMGNNCGEANTVMVFVYIKNKKGYLIMISNNDLKKKNKIYKSNNKREKR